MGLSSSSSKSAGSVTGTIPKDKTKRTFSRIKSDPSSSLRVTEKEETLDLSKAKKGSDPGTIRGPSASPQAKEPRQLQQQPQQQSQEQQQEGEVVATLIPAAVAQKKGSYSSVEGFSPFPRKKTSTATEALSAGDATIRTLQSKGSSSSIKSEQAPPKKRSNAGTEEETIQLILFGSVNSGKTTLVKALKLLYSPELELSEEERKRRADEIRTTMLNSARRVVLNTNTANWSPDTLRAANTLLSVPLPAGASNDGAEEAGSATIVRAEPEDDDDEEDVLQLIGEEDKKIPDATTMPVAVAQALGSRGPTAPTEAEAEEALKQANRAKAAELIPSLPITSATSTSLPRVNTASSSSNAASFSTGGSFSPPQKADIGRVVYDPRKHSQPVLTKGFQTGGAPYGLGGSTSPGVTKKKSSTASTASSTSSTSPHKDVFRINSKVSMTTMTEVKPQQRQDPNAPVGTVTMARAHNGAGGEEEAGEDLPVAQHIYFDAEIVDSLRTLFSDKDFQRAQLEASGESSGMNYLAENLERIAAPTYVPEGTDYLYAKSAPRTGAHMTEITINSTPFQIFDVSMNLDEAEEDWHKPYSDISAVIFLAALDIYDNPSKVKKTESNFKKICTLFKNKPVILLLNKVDLFKEKLRVVPFSAKGERNEDYQGPRPDTALSLKEFDAAVQAVQKSIVERYHSIWKRKTRGKSDIYIHVTQSTAPEQIKAIFRATKDSLLRNNLKVSGFV